MSSQYPPVYLQLNQQLSKQLAIVMLIEGIPFIFGISDTFTTVRYGDLGLIYGAPGLVYGGLRKVGGANGVGGVQAFIQLDSSMTIQQRIEPEQGVGSVGTLVMTLIDYGGLVSKIITPGIYVDEIMASKQVKIYIGFQQSSFPQDYVLLYTGYITSLDCPPGLVKFQISDSTMKSRQPIAAVNTTTTSEDIDDAVTDIPVISNGGFFTPLQGPDHTYDPIVATYIQVDSEYMKYDHTGMPDPTDFTVTRGSLGSVAASHSAGATVSNAAVLGDSVTGENFVTLALKLLLSGWGGPCETDIPLLSFVYTFNPDLGSSGFVPNAFVLGVNSDTGYPLDANLDIGLTVGDYFYISGATESGNNIAGIITGFDVLNSFTSIIYTDQVFTVENPTTGVAAFRSKYDTLPLALGSQCRMRDVDVQTMEMIRNTYFVSSIYQVSMFYNAPVFAKDTIAQDLFLPMGCYQISRYGRISMSVTKPPLPGISSLVTLDDTNVIDPDKIHVTRATNNRTFYNEISYEYDFDPVSGNYASIQYFLDLNSANEFQQALTLPIVATALKSSLGAGSVAQIRGEALLTRYKDIALMIELTVNWSVGSLIEVSDIVLLNDNGQLQIMNFQTGERNLGAQLFEVIDRTYAVTQGNVKLKLLGGLGFDVNSRFALVSPSSILNSGCTNTSLRLIPSFGQTNIASEVGKWTSFVGLPIRVHNTDYSTDGTATLIGVDPSDSTALQITDLGFTPGATLLVDIAPYPTDTNKNENKIYKNLYTYVTPTIAVTSGVSNTQFTVGSGDIAQFTVGNFVVLRKADYSDNPLSEVFTSSLAIQSIVSTTITLVSSMGFTPDNTYVVEGIGFHDGLGYYRYG